MGQQCGDLETYQGMTYLVIFKLGLKSEPNQSGSMAQWSESEFYQGSTSGAGSVEGPGHIKI